MKLHAAFFRTSTPPLGEKAGMSGLSLRRIRPLLFASIFVFGSFSALAQPIPPLRPAHGEINLTFGEQHGWQIIIAATILAVAIAAFIILLIRPKMRVPEPPEVWARRSLAALRGRSPDGPLLMEVSRIFRRYVIFAFELPSQELTTAELNQALQSAPKAEPALAAAITSFLRQCDLDKFASRHGPPLADAATSALELLERIEAHRRRFLPQPSAA